MLPFADTWFCPWYMTGCCTVIDGMNGWNGVLTLCISGVLPGIWEYCWIFLVWGIDVLYILDVGYCIGIVCCCICGYGGGCGWLGKCTFGVYMFRWYGSYFGGYTVVPLNAF